MRQWLLPVAMLIVLLLGIGVVWRFHHDPAGSMMRMNQNFEWHFSHRN